MLQNLKKTKIIYIEFNFYISIDFMNIKPFEFL